MISCPAHLLKYAYDGIGNRTSSQVGSTADRRNYSANSLNQYVSILSPGVIPIRRRAEADAKVAVTTTIGGTSATYMPERSGQDFSIDIPVDNSQGAVTAAVQVDALRHDDTLDIDLHRRLSGDYTVPAAVPEAPAYDLDGNMLSHDGWACAWNAQDRLVSATKGTTRLEFAYDYLGRRFEKKVYESNVLVKHQLFVYDGFKQIAEYDALDSNALANTYLWQPVGLDVPILRNGGEFCVSDANKNIVVLVDTTGSVTDTYIYDPFGNCAHTGTSANPFRFSSEYFDEETGLVYYNFRYFSSKLGRWIKRDSIGEIDDINIYQYAHNNPSNLFDRYGLSVDSITASLNDAIATGNVEAVKTILEAASGLLPKTAGKAAVAFLVKNTICKELHRRYKQNNCKKCDGNCTSRTQAAASARCFANEIQDRMRYLAMDCDAVLEGSIKRGVNVARKGHWDEYAQNRQQCLNVLKKQRGNNR